MRARLGVTEHLVEPCLDPGRDRALEAHRLLVRLGPAEPDDRRQQPFDQRVAPEDRVCGRPAGRRQVQLPAVRVCDEPVGNEAAEHLARGLRGDAKVPRHLGGGDLRPVGRHHAQREQILLGRGREVAGVLAAGHGLRIRDRAGPNCAASDWWRHRRRRASRPSGRRRGPWRSGPAPAPRRSRRG